MQEMSNKEYIKSRLSYRALFEQLAEESAELCQVSIKVIRACISEENPTPIDKQQALKMLIEEFNDVLVVANILGFDLNTDKIPDDHPKIVRWVERLRAKEVAKNGGEV